MATYVLRGKTGMAKATFISNREQEVLEMTKKAHPEIDWIDCKELKKDQHICPYCGDIAEGTYDKLLCSLCREIFGHSLIDEL